MALNTNKYQSQESDTRPDNAVRCSCGELRIQERINAIPDDCNKPFIHLATADRCGGRCGRIWGIRMEQHNAFGITPRMVQSIYSHRRMSAYTMAQLRAGVPKDQERGQDGLHGARNMFPPSTPAKRADYNPNAHIEPSEKRLDEMPF